MMASLPEIKLFLPTLKAFCLLPVKEPSTDAAEGSFRMLFVLGVLQFFANLATASSDDPGQGTALHSQFPTELGK